MRLVFLLLLVVSCFAATAQPTWDELPTARFLALDTTMDLAEPFNSEVVKAADSGYRFTFMDKGYNKVVYIYENEKGESVRIEYQYRVSGADFEKRLPGVATIMLTKISADASATANIYNAMFGAAIVPQELLSSSTSGSMISYLGKEHQFILQADDYKPGYWVMTFVK